MSSGRRRQEWGPGSVFLLPLADGRWCVGQVIGRGILRSTWIVLFDLVVASSDVPALTDERIFASIMVTTDLLDSGQWRVAGSAPEPGSDWLAGHVALQEAGYVGATIRGSGNVEEFVNAFYGLVPWDDWYVPNYLDAFLVSPEKKPTERLKYSGRHAGPPREQV